MPQSESTINKRERAMKLIRQNAQSILSLMESEVDSIAELTVLRAWFDELDIIDLCMHLERDIDAGIPDAEVEGWVTISDVIDSCEKRM